MRFNKPPLTYDEQIALLKSRGILIEDEERTKRHLSNISYYRLSAYMLPYKKLQEDGSISDKFKKGTKWNTVYNLYVFDRKLRLLVFDAIERLEVAIRAQIIHKLCAQYGSHWQDNSSIFKPAQSKILKNGVTIEINVFKDIQKHVLDQMKNNKAEVFIKHYISKYDSPTNPPAWMCVEIMYFNHLSHICSSLKKRSDKSLISNYFDLTPETFCSWLHTINYVRNLCAHHSRLWNRDINIVPEKLLFSKNHIWISNPDQAQRSKLYFFFCMLNYMLQTANPTSNFSLRLIDLLNEYRDTVKLSAMGFPSNWGNEDIWKMKDKD